MLYLVCLIAVVLAAQVLDAQSAPVSVQEANRARQLLQSPSWVDRSWGVYLAGRLHSDELESLLVEQFRSAAELRDFPSYTEEHAFLAVLFDALIEAGIKVPAAMLSPFEHTWTAPVLILSARTQDSEDLLLSLRKEDSKDLVWLAANNILFERKSQRWYEAMLGEITITHRFTVVDTSETTGVGGGSGGGSVGCGVGAMPKGFPPVALYSLQDFAEQGSVLLARGPQNVFYKRTTFPTNKQMGYSSVNPIVNRMAMRFGYLAELGPWPKSLPETERLFHRETEIHYAGVEGFKLQIEQSITAQVESIRSLIQAIDKQGLAAPEMHFRITLEVSDQRQHASDPLPRVGPREFDLQKP